MLETVIVGAGPYGLSVAAHLRSLGMSFRIFGRAMDSWRAHMPKGMLLKSDGFASNIYEPQSELTLKKFCEERGIHYSDAGIPVSLETFTQYGITFQQRIVPELEDKQVVSLQGHAEGFSLRLDDGTNVIARRVVLAVGISHFDYVPQALSSLSPEFVSHSGRHNEVESFKGRSVIVIGGGSSALDWAALLHEAGVDVQLVARRTELKFHGRPTGRPRTLLQRMRHPQSGLGPGWRSRFYANAPGLFRHLPQNLRLEIVRRTLGPSGGWFIRDKVIGQVPLMLGYTLQRAEVENGKVRIQLRDRKGKQRMIHADHVIAATGYKVDLNRLDFLGQEIRSRIKTVNSTPVLSSGFESTVPGLYFVGVAAATSFGPVMRFAFGAGYAARTIAREMSRPRSEESLSRGMRERTNGRRMASSERNEKADAVSQRS